MDHNILFQKLCHYGIRGSALTWFTSYLSNRKQFTSYDGNNSELCNILCGVPQGSILGPLLFIIYINDIWHVSTKSSVVLFADDTNIFLSNRNLNLLHETIRSELPHLNYLNWFSANSHFHLILIKKKHYVVFNSKNSNDLT